MGSNAPAMRIGHGYDLHRLEPIADGGARPLVIGGVRFDHDRGPIARSDGDALYHAVTDAILGALGEPDIGQLYPDTDPRQEGRDSSIYVQEAVRRANAAGWEVGNLDATVILERPKLSEHREAIRENLRLQLFCPIDRVNVKGKTHERVDAVGEGRAIEVHAVVSLVRIK